ncbi:MAG: VPLPA-CTERM sorting domain-containing protein [Chromatiales bacterium]|jgi:hypothetical protein|nr:VPLPA-CTERM sorting domain-containing protein [Chromatiales bacterium]
MLAHRLVAVLATGLACVAGTANAALITFTDRAAFLAATGATDATGPLPFFDNPVSGNIVAGSVTFTVNTAYFGGVVVGDWSTLNPGAELVISNGLAPTIFSDSFDASFAAPVYAAGFDMVEPGSSTLAVDGCNLPCVDSTFTVSLRSGGTLVDSFTFNAPNDGLAFVGVWSTSPFDRVEIRETVGTDDNEFWGRFYTGTNPAVIPVPAAGWLLATGLGVLGAASKRRPRRG